MEANTADREQSPSQSRATSRPKRVPLHNRDILTVHNKNPNKVYRWVNDIDDRLYRFKQAGWEFVTDKGICVGEPTVNANTELGSVVVKRTGSTELFLMAIEREFYDEDQAAKAQRIKDTEATMYEQLNSSSDGRYGRVKMGFNPED